jgi:DNA-binding transcriptional MerR regulator/effector-binding domain-containing protein
MSVSIGEFSRLSHLSAKTLRYYHQIDLLVPDDVDPGTGYRRYSPHQVGDAHLIRRLRELDMPLAEIREVLDEPDSIARDSAIARHLDRMEAELTRTREVVASLRRLLGAPAQVPVSHRQSPAVPAVSTSARVRRSDVAAWCGSAYPSLYETLARAGVEPAGSGGATYSTEFFEQDEGLISAFVPVPPSAASVPGFVVLPPQRFAVAVHTGRFTDCDLTYGYLGGHVASHDVGLAEPIRELYLVGPDHTDDPTRFQTEICWPIAL